MPETGLSVTLIFVSMVYTVNEVDFDWLDSCWKDSDNGLKWEPIFVSPPWLKVWHQTFAPEARLCLCTVGQADRIIGIAPLLLKGDTASLIGSDDVCDFLDFVVVPRKERDFFRGLFHHLKRDGISRLDLGLLRPDSVAMSSLSSMTQNCEVSNSQVDVSLELDLPATWDEYLGTLNTKQRHELRRKTRRLGEAGNVNYRIVESTEAVADFMGLFFRLFAHARKDKAMFMTEKMKAFFVSLARGMAEAGLLRSGVLELDNTPVAAVMAFDYNDVVYLYNSSWDPKYDALSVGILSKAFLIEDGIERGKKKFDFLKGDEHYKYHLGGKEVPLYSCKVAIK